MLVDRAGVERPIEFDVPSGGEDGGQVLVFRDSSEAALSSLESERRLTRDTLTGLINRAEFERRLADAVRSARAEAAEHALLHIDLDKFRLINDACGHRVGDLLLKEVAALLAGMVRATDTLARVGGDEFAVIMEDCPAALAEAAAQRICDRLEAFRFTREGLRLRIGASIGLVVLGARCGDVSAVVQAAVNSCLAAGEEGGSRVQVWSATASAFQVRQGEMQWATRIELALDDDRYTLFGQRIEPLTAGTSGLHAEVLLRMVDIDGSLIPPGMFLPAAERFHLATRIDRWVLKRTVAWLKALPAPERIAKLSVNLSGQSIGDRSFHGWALELLADAGDALCRRLCFEITETAAVAHMAEAARFVAQLHQVGVRVALDDFGAGASSFGYLKRLPVDYLKIDGQFIRELLTDPLNDAAVRCFVDVARVVGVRTVAEFVDQPAVLERLREMGVDFAQGFLLHRPEPIDAMLRAVPVPVPELVRAPTLALATLVLITPARRTRGRAGLEAAPPAGARPAALRSADAAAPPRPADRRHPHWPPPRTRARSRPGCRSSTPTCTTATTRGSACRLPPPSSCCATRA